MSETAKNPQTMADLLLNTKRTLRAFRRGEVVEGVVISSGRREIFVDLGAKSEGIISSRELEESPNSISGLEVGDKVIASVVQTENDQGYTILSLSRAESERSWRRLEEALASREVLTVKVVDANKGGLVVETGTGTRGFVPFSHLRQQFSDTEASSMLNQTLSVIVIELNRPNNRLVFSEKMAALLSDPKIKAFYEILKPSKKMKGRVTSVSPFGVFVELTPGVEGLVHISEVGWERVEHPSEVVKEGDKVDVVVLSIDQERGQLALSMKALQKNPWERVAKKYKVGDIVSGKVTKTVPFGAFVRLPEGVEGLIHVSETTGPLDEGDEVKAVVINLEPEKQKLGLSVKQLKQ
jgi:small subunit ribosomal protein S1